VWPGAKRRKHRRQNATTSHILPMSNRPNAALASSLDPIFRLHSNITAVVPITLDASFTAIYRFLGSPIFGTQHLTIGIHPAHIRQDALRYHGPSRYKDSPQERPVREERAQPRDWRRSILPRRCFVSPSARNKDQQSSLGRQHQCHTTLSEYARC
jgi:hypothetical protein